MQRPITTRERLEDRESELSRKIGVFVDRLIMSDIDGALHLIGGPALDEYQLAELRDRLVAARVSHNLPKLDPRLVKAGDPEHASDEIKGLPTKVSFTAMLGDIKEALFVKKDALIAENRIAIRRARGFGKARKAIHNLLRDHGANARRALEAMAAGGPAPSWVLRSVAVAAAPKS